MGKLHAIVFLALLILILLFLFKCRRIVKKKVQETDYEPIVGPEPERGAEIPVKRLSLSASVEERQKFKWETKVRTIAKNITEATDGTIQAVNFCYFDRLVDVRGKNRPIAYYVPPKSSSLSHGGVFIYETTRMKDNSLYLFCGPESPEPLRELGVRLLNIMHKEWPTANVVRIIGTEETPAFQRMIHVMGGHTRMMQSSHNAGDQYLFEVQFFKMKLNVTVFTDNKKEGYRIEHPSLDVLPDRGVAVVDTSDNALYLYVADVTSDDPQDIADRQAAIDFMNSHKEFRTRDLLIFDKTCVPPNLQVIFGVAFE